MVIIYIYNHKYITICDSHLCCCVLIDLIKLKNSSLPFYKQHSNCRKLIDDFSLKCLITQKSMCYL